jgi:hypothetical protein
MCILLDIYISRFKVLTAVIIEVFIIYVVVSVSATTFQIIVLPESLGQNR